MTGPSEPVSPGSRRGRSRFADDVDDAIIVRPEHQVDPPVGLRVVRDDPAPDGVDSV